MRIKTLYRVQRRTRLMQEAKKAAVNSNQVITFNDEIIKMSAGLAISNPPTGK